MSAYAMYNGSSSKELKKKDKCDEFIKVNWLFHKNTLETEVSERNILIRCFHLHSVSALWLKCRMS